MRLEFVDKLKRLSREFKSYALMEMASRAQVDPFAKVTGLGEDMGTELMNGASEEASHKSFRDEELEQTTKSMGEKTMKIDNFAARMGSAGSMRPGFPWDAMVSVTEKEDPFAPPPWGPAAAEQ